MRMATSARATSTFASAPALNWAILYHKDIAISNSRLALDISVLSVSLVST